MAPRQQELKEQEEQVTAYLLDTHIWIWVQQRNAGELTAEAFSRVENWQRLGQAFVSAISILEIARLVADGQLDIPSTVDQFIVDATIDGGLQLLPLSPRILIESTRLPGKIHRDPADRLLAATAREHSLTLVTRDKELLAYARKGHIQALNL
jgi:PIN domain nuclease of toxin-antitoxin system